MSPRILIAGGYGVIGSAIARRLRRAHPEAVLILAGRNPDQGRALAEELGGTRLLRLDVAGPIPAAVGAADLVVTSLYDPANALALAALAGGAAHIGTTTKAEDALPIVAAAVRTPARRPVVLAGHAMAGIATLVAARVARRFARVDRVAVTGIFDPADPVGPMTAGDAEGLVVRALVREGGNWAWIDGLRHPTLVRFAGMDAIQAFPSGLMDAPSIAAATGAADVRFDVAPVPSLGTRGGRAASSDLHIAMAGLLSSGAPATLETIVSDPRGIAHLTALGVLVLAERALGLDGRPAAPGGLYLPESLADPERAVAVLERDGVCVFTGEAPLVDAWSRQRGRAAADAS